MCTKFFSDGAVHAYFNPYETPYDAFMNYMNVLSDFEIRIDRMCPATDEQIQILKLDSQIKAKDELITSLSSENETLKKKLQRLKPKTKIAAKDPRSLAQIAAEAIAKSGVTVRTGKVTSAKKSAGKTVKSKTTKSKTSTRKASGASGSKRSAK
jgi:alpha-amylase